MRPAVAAAKPKAPQAGSRFEQDHKFDKLRPAVHRGPGSNSTEHGYWRALLTVSIGWPILSVEALSHS
ncbi:hypothetical protein [Neorhizobium sp. SHOUNA12B]|uniref:hypothetical protein n=1 Tax=Neorhizobium sp. SHOUNA12B TaxID=2908928 RepID=UPI0025F298A6|nr:hypothetical protein [Neorhizobium sp. SHOUNA12B]MCJ9671434.1 hypothetical protein [Neorhizobium sp. SHOUNA12B]